MLLPESYGGESEMMGKKQISNGHILWDDLGYTNQ
jgi:hypothetical protein